MQIVSATPLGNDVVPIDSGRTVTVMLKLAEAVRGGFPESASRTAKFEVPAVHGAPSIVPSVPRVNPVGKEPEATLQEKRSEEHTSELQSRLHLVCRLLLEKKKKRTHVKPSRRNKISRRN